MVNAIKKSLHLRFLKTRIDHIDSLIKNTSLSKNEHDKLSHELSCIQRVVVKIEKMESSFAEPSSQKHVLNLN